MPSDNTVADNPASDDPAAGWLRLAADIGGRLDRRGGLSGTVGVVISATTEGDRPATLVWEDGRVTAASLGASPRADVTFTLPAADARAVLAGELRPSVAFMQGRLKTAGDNGLVIGVLGACEGDPLATWLDAVHRVVD
jgi:hypothetical protein